MNPIRFIPALIAIFSAQVYAQGSIDITARCPDSCNPDFLDAFRTCARFSTIGCVFEPCDGGFTCVLPEPIDTDIEVTPGGDVVIRDLRVADFFKFNVNLNASFPLRTDVYLLTDATGSIRTAIGQIRGRFNDILNIFEGTTDLHFGVGFYRDELDAGLDDGFKNLQSLTGNRNLVATAVASLTAQGGRDRPEANLVALHKVATDSSIGWRSDSRKILVYFGDNPGHEPSCVGGDTITRASVINDLNAKNIIVVATEFTDTGSGLDGTPTRFGCSSGSAGPGQATAITSATGGVFAMDTSQAAVIESITSAVLSIDRIFDLDASDCSDGLNIQTSPTLPLTLMEGESAVVCQLNTIRAGICDGGNTFECTLKYTEGGASLPVTRMRLLDIKGCPDLSL